MTTNVKVGDRVTRGNACVGMRFCAQRYFPDGRQFEFTSINLVTGRFNYIDVGQTHVYSTTFSDMIPCLVTALPAEAKQHPEVFDIYKLEQLTQDTCRVGTQFTNDAGEALFEIVKVRTPGLFDVRVVRGTAEFANEVVFCDLRLGIKPQYVVSVPPAPAAPAAATIGWIDAPPEPPAKDPPGHCRHGRAECTTCDWERNYNARETNRECMGLGDSWQGQLRRHASTAEAERLLLLQHEKVHLEVEIRALEKLLGKAR